MKKITLASLLLAGLLSQAFAQEPERINNVKVNLFSPLVRTVSAFYERKVSPSASVQLGFSFTGAELDEVNIDGWSITPEFRYYATQKGAMEGFYVAPFMRFGNFDLDDKVSKAEMKTIGGGLLVGHQWVFSKGLSLDVFLGPSYNTGNIKITQGTTEPDTPSSIDGFGIRSGLTLGIAF